MIKIIFFITAFNDADYTTILTVTNETGWGVSEKRTFSVSPPIAEDDYRYIRLTVDAINADGLGDVAELEYFTCDSSASASGSEAPCVNVTSDFMVF